MTAEGSSIRLLTLTIILSLSTTTEPSPLTVMGRTLTDSITFLEKKSVENDAKWVENDRELAELKNLTQMKELMELKDFVEIFNSAFVCRNDSVPFSGRCYTFVRGSYTWYQARDKCAKNGSHLASVTSKALHDLIVSKLPNMDVWLSGNDIANDGKWVWHDGKAVGGGGAYTNWHSGHPDYGTGNGSPDCMYINHGSGQWAVYGCSNSLVAYVCETRRVPRSMTTLQ